MRKDKARDIARGVLPSTARKGARDNKRNFHATHRHSQRQVNHAILRHCTDVDDDGNLYTDPDLFDDFEDLDTFDGYHAATTKPSIGWDGMNEIVSNRRGADKLGPLISWATATEKNKMVGWDVADKIAYFKAVLPDSLQGRHALGHVKIALRLDNDEYSRFLYNRPPPYTKEAFRPDLARHLSTSKSRAALRESIVNIVPVAAHAVHSNNKIRSYEPVVDENGKRRFHRDTNIPLTVEIYVPQIVHVTCDDCAFLRNDPLATTAAINRFVEIVWGSRKDFNRPSRYTTLPVDGHDFMHKIIECIWI